MLDNTVSSKDEYIQTTRTRGRLLVKLLVVYDCVLILKEMTFVRARKKVFGLSLM